MPKRFALAVLTAIIIFQSGYGEFVSRAQEADTSAHQDENRDAGQNASDSELFENSDEFESDYAITPGIEAEDNALIHNPDFEDGSDEIRPLRGDFDLDGVLDEDKDLRLLAKHVGRMDADLSYDVNGDGEVTQDDTRFWIEKIRGLLIGDANHDRRVNSSDVTTAFEAAKFQTGEPASWSTGDWNGDGFFDEADMDFMLMGGAYEKVPRQPATSNGVTEPIFLSLIGMGLVFLLLAYTAIQGQKTARHQLKSEGG